MAYGPANVIRRRRDSLHKPLDSGQQAPPRITCRDLVRKHRDQSGHSTGRLRYDRLQPGPGFVSYMERAVAVAFAWFFAGLALSSQVDRQEFGTILMTAQWSGSGCRVIRLAAMRHIRARGASLRSGRITSFTPRKFAQSEPTHRRRHFVVSATDHDCLLSLRFVHAYGSQPPVIGEHSPRWGLAASLWLPTHPDDVARNLRNRQIRSFHNWDVGMVA